MHPLLVIVLVTVCEDHKYEMQIYVHKHRNFYTKLLTGELLFIPYIFSPRNSAMDLSYIN